MKMPSYAPRASATRAGVTDALIALVLGLGSGTLYVATCAPSVLFGDSGEFQFVPYILGIAHPTGYPLYLLLGWLWSHLLPMGDVAYRMNLFSVLWAALAVGLSYPLALRIITDGLRVTSECDDSCRRSDAKSGDFALREANTLRLAAATVSATFAVGQTFWSQAVIAEVYSFNAFFVVLVLLLLLRAMEMPLRPGRMLALAVAYGFSLTHHRTMLLLIPGMLAYVWLSGRLRESHSLKWRTVPALAVGLVAPLLLYLYLPLRAPFVPYATLSLGQDQTLTLYSNTWRGFVDHLTAAVFAGNLRLSGNQPLSAAALAERLVMVWHLLRGQVGVAGAILALAGLVWLAVGRRRDLLALTGLCYLLIVLFNALYTIGDIAVLFIPSYLFVSLWIGLGVAMVAAQLSRWLTQGTGFPVTRAISLASLALVLPVVLLAIHLPAANQSANTGAADMWQPILARQIPIGSELLTNDRDEMMPLWYYQYVEGRRPDLLGLFPGIVTDPAYADVGGLVDQVLASRRPAYLIKPMPGLEVKARLEATPRLTPLVQLEGPAAASPPMHTTDLTLGGLMRLIGYDLLPTHARPGDDVSLSLYWQPAAKTEHNYTSFVHALDEFGQIIAQSDHRSGGEYYPTSLWRPTDVLRDTHVLTIPVPTRPGTYRLLVGMYQYPSMEPLGQAVTAGLLPVDNAGSP
jgi:hypothetical protein